MFRIKYLLY